MTFDLQAILQNKSDMRRNLAARPIEEKLAMLDLLRERTVALRDASPLKLQTLKSEELSQIVHVPD